MINKQLATKIKEAFGCDSFIFENYAKDELENYIDQLGTIIDDSSKTEGEHSNAIDELGFIHQLVNGFPEESKIIGSTIIYSPNAEVIYNSLAKNQEFKSGSDYEVSYCGYRGPLLAIFIHSKQAVDYLKNEIDKVIEQKQKKTQPSFSQVTQVLFHKITEQTTKSDETVLLEANKTNSYLLSK